jgi:hypothetical protein
VYFFLCESQGRTLEEIDTMYIMKVNPLKSSKWQAPEGVDLSQGGGDPKARLEALEEQQRRQKQGEGVVE